MENKEKSIPEQPSEDSTFKENPYRDQVIAKDIENKNLKLEGLINELENKINRELEVTKNDIKNLKENFNEFKKDYKEDFRNRVSRKTMIWWIIVTLIIGLLGGGFLIDKILDLFN